MTARGAATRARIVEAAAGLIYDRGVGGTSLDDVMRASSTSKSQLYHYFADKDALIGAVIQAQTCRVLAFQATLLDHVETLAGLRGWRDAIVAATEAACGVGGCPLGTLGSELADRSENARALVAEGFQAWELRLASCLRRLREHGELDPGAEPNDLAASLIGALQGGLLLAQTTRTVRSLKLVLDMALEHVGSRAKAGVL
ncbi:TetR/AcrR family transcriptional regulator [Lichenifustis flavocetrariae]|uniref:TetR family transcriptional regulator C-terminal domain-containing protein n=1 Tax=Lichenifustis flavocetrariae TaxID=2949735 RepID=A0AA42CMD8_9HYPH|nr:TetR/AcrR family transcriptional regulator [Lichenifustis flavocetrariae]MCW6512574.1 TetR family transcriptional regulator C-terminal domain-containing protein [Lichenifustis flavocetrariae]